MNKIIVLLGIAISTSAISGPFDSYLKEDNSPPTTKQKASVENNGSFSESLKQATSSLIVNSTSSAKAKASARKAGITPQEQIELEKQEFLRQQIESKKNLKAILQNKTKFVQKVKSIRIKKHNSYTNIFIPFNNLSQLAFDQEIKEIAYLKQDNIDIKKKKESNKVLEILNKNANLLINVKITFIDEMVINLIIQTGDRGVSRFVDYKIYTDGASLKTKTIFLKPTKVKTIHDDFNNKSIFLILSRLTKNATFKTLQENMISVDKILFSGTTVIQGVSGSEDISYTVKLNNVFESPFMKTSKEDDEKRRLVLMEVSIKNDSHVKTLTINDVLLKNRFSGMVAAWLGDLDRKDNILSPKEQKNILIVVEDRAY